MSEQLRERIAKEIHSKNDKCSGNPCECYEMADTVLKGLAGGAYSLTRDFQAWKAEVLLYFREAPIAQAVETQQEVNGIVESRRALEKLPKVGTGCNAEVAHYNIDSNAPKERK